MRSLSVGADAEDGDVAFGSFLVSVAEPARFFRSAGRVVFRVKKQHDFFAFEIGELHRFARRVVEAEDGCLVADFKFCGHQFSSFDVAQTVSLRRFIICFSVRPDFFWRENAFVFLRQRVIEATQIDSLHYASFFNNTICPA
jgi:hypothetical protein